MNLADFEIDGYKADIKEEGDNFTVIRLIKDESDPLVSAVIPYYENSIAKKPILDRCIKSLPAPIGEVIVVKNDRYGYAPSINKGLANAKGKFLLVMNDDVFHESGDINDLCVEGVVTSPSNHGRTYPHIWGSVFCLPKEVYEKIGGMDERYTVSYFDDDDLILTLQKEGVAMKAVPSVAFGHPDPGTTLEAMPDRNEFFEANKQKFQEKWGRLP